LEIHDENFDAENFVNFVQFTGYFDGFFEIMCAFYCFRDSRYVLYSI